jgi:hypothetical protein
VKLVVDTLSSNAEDFGFARLVMLLGVVWRVTLAISSTSSAAAFPARALSVEAFPLAAASTWVM